MLSQTDSCNPCISENFYGDPWIASVMMSTRLLPLTKLVACALALLSEHDASRATIRDLMALTGVSIDTAYTHIKRLQDLGWLHIEGGGPHRPRVYTFVLPEGGAA